MAWALLSSELRGSAGSARGSGDQVAVGAEELVQ